MSGHSPGGFPCELPIKVFGRNSQGFRDAVRAIMHAHNDDLGEDCISEQQSRRGRYLSITIRIQAASRAEADRVYRALTASEEVLMVL